MTIQRLICFAAVIFSQLISQALYAREAAIWQNDQVTISGQMAKTEYTTEEDPILKITILNHSCGSIFLLREWPFHSLNLTLTQGDLGAVVPMSRAGKGVVSVPGFGSSFTYEIQNGSEHQIEIPLKKYFDLSLATEYSVRLKGFCMTEFRSVRTASTPGYEYELDNITFSVKEASPPISWQMESDSPLENVFGDKYQWSNGELTVAATTEQPKGLAILSLRYSNHIDVPIRIPWSDSLAAITLDVEIPEYTKSLPKDLLNQSATVDLSHEQVVPAQKMPLNALGEALARPVENFEFISIPPHQSVLIRYDLARLFDLSGTHRYRIDVQGTFMDSENRKSSYALENIECLFTQGYYEHTQ